jgi:hypothetical protein
MRETLLVITPGSCFALPRGFAACAFASVRSRVVEVPVVSYQARWRANLPNHAAKRGGLCTSSSSGLHRRRGGGITLGQQLSQ